MIYPHTMPDDFRRDYYDLRRLIEEGQRYGNEQGNVTCHIELSVARADAIEARLAATPHNTIFIQTPRGRYQVIVGESIVITALDQGKHIIVGARSGNEIEIGQRYDT